MLGCFFTVSETRPKQAAVLCEASLHLFDFSHRRCYSVTRSALPGSPNPFFPAHVHHSTRPHFLLHCDWFVCTPFFGLLEYRLDRIWFGVLNCSRVPDTGKVNKTSGAAGLSHAQPVSRLSGCDSPPCPWNPQVFTDRRGLQSTPRVTASSFTFLVTRGQTQFKNTNS